MHFETSICDSRKLQSCSKGDAPKLGRSVARHKIYTFPHWEKKGVIGASLKFIIQHLEDVVNAFLKGLWQIITKIQKRCSMNFIICSENCRHQKDGYCMLEDLTQPCGNPSAPCKYYHAR